MYVRAHAHTCVKFPAVAFAVCCLSVSICQRPLQREKSQTRLNFSERLWFSRQRLKEHRQTPFPFVDDAKVETKKRRRKQSSVAVEF